MPRVRHSTPEQPLGSPVARRRAELPLGGEVATDYEFEDSDGTAKIVRLSDLFEDGKDTLYLYSFMWVPESQGLSFIGPCPSCTAIIDAMDGEVPHITQACGRHSDR